jgi:hypothetical protein
MGTTTARMRKVGTGDDMTASAYAVGLGSP